MSDVQREIESACLKATALGFLGITSASDAAGLLANPMRTTTVGQALDHAAENLEAAVDQVRRARALLELAPGGDQAQLCGERSAALGRSE